MASADPEPTTAPNASSPVRVWTPPWPLGRVAATAWALPWLALVIADVITTPRCADPVLCAPHLAAPSYWLTGLSVTALAVPLVLAISPRVGIWFAAAVAAGLGFVDPLGTWWLVLSGALVVFGLARTWIIARGQRRSRSIMATETTPKGIATLSPAQLGRLAPSRVLTVGVPAITVLIAVLLAGWHQTVWDQERRFAYFAAPSSRVVVITGDVNSLDIPPGAQVVVTGDFSSASSGGVRLQVWIVTHPAVEVTVPEVRDPSWMLGLSLGLIGLGLAFRSRWRISAREMATALGAQATPATLAILGRGAAIMIDERPVGYLDPVRLAGLADQTPGASNASEGDQGAVTGFDVDQPVDLQGPLSAESLVVITQGETVALARLQDPWPLARVGQRRGSLAGTDHGLDGSEVTDAASDPDPTELPTDAPLL